MRGIEIGPSYRPLCPKNQGWNTLVVDHATRAELVAKYTAWKVDTSLIRLGDVIVMVKTTFEEQTRAVGYASP